MGKQFLNAILLEMRICLNKKLCEEIGEISIYDYMDKPNNSSNQSISSEELDLTMKDLGIQNNTIEQ